MSTTTNLDTLKINYLTQAQYDEALANDEINENEIYMTPSDNEMADYVVETSSNSYWRWVKWNSGRVELWGWFSQADVSAYATNSFVIGSASVTPYPFTISEPRTIVSGQKIGTGGCVVDYDYGRTDYWSGIAHGTISSWAQGSTQTITWTCYVNARWK